MRKTCVFIATSLDGRISGANDDISWMFNDQDYGYEDFYDEVSTVVMGRKTYEVSRSMGDYPYSEVESVVFSETKKGQKDEYTTFATGSVAETVKQLKNAEGKKGKIWIVGGSRLICDCLEAGVVDELRLFVHPVILGEGAPLFRPGLKKELTFVSAQSFGTGLLELRYKSL